MSVDNLKGFSEAISSVFPKTEIQKCVVHQIRNSIRYISYKDAREFTSDLSLKEATKKWTGRIPG